jgi:hypothetical protein
VDNPIALVRSYIWFTLSWAETQFSALLHVAQLVIFFPPFLGNQAPLFLIILNPAALTVCDREQHASVMFITNFNNQH